MQSGANAYDAFANDIIGLLASGERREGLLDLTCSKLISYRSNLTSSSFVQRHRAVRPMWWANPRMKSWVCKGGGCPAQVSWDSLASVNRPESSPYPSGVV